jgi:predicted SAM-dependent methyltransferase
MKLHIGGEAPKDEWKLFNIVKKPGVDYIGDISDLSMFRDNSCTEIYASHVFEHVKLERVFDTLVGVRRILAPGGKLYISVPNLDILCRIYLEPKAPLEVKFEAMQIMYGGQSDCHDIHYVGWNEVFLTHYMKIAGFSYAERVVSFGIFNDMSDFKLAGIPISLNMIFTN